MCLKPLCTILLTFFLAKVDYAQLITINALGKYVTGGKKSNVSLTSSTQSDTTVNVSGKPISASSIDSTKNKFSLPLSYLMVTSLFGQRYHPILHYSRLHAGIDLRASYEGVFAFAEGIVIKAGYDVHSGNFITILHGSYGKEDLTSAYAHLSYLNVGVGDLVQAGQVIGISGNTGSSTAPHLHFALRINNKSIDPLPVLRCLLQQFNMYQLNQ